MDKTNQQFSEEVLFSTDTEEDANKADAHSNSEKEDDKESKVR